MAGACGRGEVRAATGAVTSALQERLEERIAEHPARWCLVYRRRGDQHKRSIV